MHEKHESREENESNPSVNWILLGLGVLFVLSAWQTFQLSNTLSTLNARASGAAFSAAGPPSATASAQSGVLDQSGWTANEKMNYEMHGIIPARAQGTAAASNPAASNAGGTNDITQGLPSQVGGC